jgi:serine/threonine kinase 16
MILNSFLKKNRHFDVAGQRYTMEEEIGEGAFAYVYRVKDKAGANFALKKMICQTEDQLSEAQKEIRILSEMQHENILHIHAQSIEINKAGQHEAHILLPLYERSLQNVIDSSPGYPSAAVSSPRIAVKIVRGCVAGVEALHARGYRHGDFKPANILLNSDWRPVIMDFGSVEPLRVEVTSRSQALALQESAATNTTASYRAPELFDTPSSCIIDGKADVWGLGCTIFALLFSRTPFENPIDGLSTLAVLSGRFSIPPSTKWAPEWHTMVQACLRVDLDSRLSIQDLKLVASLLSEEEFVPVLAGAAVGGGEEGAAVFHIPSESFADFAHFPPKPEAEAGLKVAAKKSASGRADKAPAAPAIASAGAVVGASRRVSFGEWQAAPLTGADGDDQGARCGDDADCDDEDFEFGDFVEATGAVLAIYLLCMCLSVS